MVSYLGEELGSGAILRCAVRSVLLQKPTILIVADSTKDLASLPGKIDHKSYRVLKASNLSSARESLDTSKIDLIITRMDKRTCAGFALLGIVRELPLGPAILLVQSADASREVREVPLRWMERLLLEPFDESDFSDAINRTIQKMQFRRQLAASGLIGGSLAMHDVFRAISRAASTNATVLITGESGTGKELVALGVHYLGPRKSKLFIPVVCGAIPETLLESQLFGHLKGAFTGASETRAGFFQAADGGSIFLDEISETTLAMQVRLLRVLQDKEVFPVGATQAKKLDVRVLAATNKDLAELVQKGLFREDLYYRLNVISIEVPPLRAREDDIPILVRHFTQKFAAEYGMPKPSFTVSALKVLKSYYWPGNVRELENVIQRVVLMTEGEEVDLPDLPPLLRSTRRKVGLHRTLAEVEREHVREVLISVRNNKTRAAQILGIDRKTLRSKLRQEGTLENE